jgi:hypothetical protein
MRLTDTAGEEVRYLPITLNAGEESAPLSLLATPQAPGERLRSSYSLDAKILGRIGAGAYQDLRSSPLDLTGYYGTTVTVQIKIQASALITGVRRVGQFLGVSSGKGAGWVL